MSTDGRPRTRAELRALREAAAAAEAAAAEESRAEADVAESAGPEPTPAVPEAGPAVPEPTPARAEEKTPGEDASDVIDPPDAISPPVLRADAADNARSDAASTPARRFSPFAFTLIAVLGVLAIVGGVFAAIGLTQGPRLSSVQADPQEAITLSGSRVILSANQPLEQIDPAQVTVTPEIPFTVDASGRTVGVRFSVPLDDDTEYTVTVEGVRGIGGGPASDLSTTIATPASQMYLLQRTDGDDTIWRTGIDGEAVPAFTHPRIGDFRAAGDTLVAVVEEDDVSRLLVIEPGAEPRELPLPGEGYVMGVQVSDRGGMVGVVYSDQGLTSDEGRASVLVTQPLDGSAEPTIMAVGGAEANIAEWQFVPDSSSVLFIDFDGALYVADVAAGSEPSPMGSALSIRGVERGTYTAIIQRGEGLLMRLDLADGAEEELAASDPDYGVPVAIEPFPGGTVQHVVSRDEQGLPTGQAIARVDDAGSAEILFEVGSDDTILQACPSPSGQYVAVTIAPDLVDNPFDDMLLALPERLETHLLDLRTGEPLVALAGFNISWCTSEPVL